MNVDVHVINISKGMYSIYMCVNICTYIGYLFFPEFCGVASRAESCPHNPRSFRLMDLSMRSVMAQSSKVRWEKTKKKRGNFSDAQKSKVGRLVKKCFCFQTTRLHLHY